MADNKEFFEALKQQPTEVDNNINLNPSDDDFEDMPEDTGASYEDPDEETPEHLEEGSPLNKLVDVDETADIAIMMIDGVQAPIFYLLHRQKLVKKYFENKEDYKQAAQVYALSNTDIAQQYPNKCDALIALKRKFNAMTAEYNKKQINVPLTDDEKQQLKAPMRQLVAKANYNIPPGIALAVVMSNIVIGRLIEVYWD